MSESAEETEVKFTAANWASLQSIPGELQKMNQLLAESINVSRAESLSIRASIKASDDRCEQNIKAANERINNAHARIDQQDKVQARWAAAGATAGLALGVFWAVLKFVFNRG